MMTSSGNKYFLLGLIFSSIININTKVMLLNNLHLLTHYRNVSYLRILRPWQNSEPRSITNTTLCTKCGGAGHIASDCKFTR